MGIIRRLVIDTALKAAAKVAVESGATGKAIDAVSPKLNKVTKTMTNEEAINDSFFTHHLIVEKLKRKNAEDQYIILDKDNNQKYVVKRPLSNWRYEIHIYNSKQQKIGTIKERKPFFKTIHESEKRICDIELHNNCIGQVRKYNSLSGINLSFDYNHFDVSRNIFGTKTEIKKDDKLVCRINHQFATTTSRGVYVISYNNKKYEEAFVTFSIAMDKIMSSSY